MPAETHLLPTPSCYVHITVEGQVPESWAEWLNGLQVSFRKQAGDRQTTTLSGRIVDQVALRGLLNRLWDLNLVLISLQTGEPGTDPDPK
mgnify:FL=1